MLGRRPGAKQTWDRGGMPVAMMHIYKDTQELDGKMDGWLCGWMNRWSIFQDPKWKDSTDHPQLSCKLFSSVSRPQWELGEEDGRVNPARIELGSCLFPNKHDVLNLWLERFTEKETEAWCCYCSVQSKCKRQGLNATQGLRRTSPSPLTGFLCNEGLGLHSTLHHRMGFGPRVWSTGPLL